MFKKPEVTHLILVGLVALGMSADSHCPFLTHQEGGKHLGLIPGRRGEAEKEECRPSAFRRHRSPAVLCVQDGALVLVTHKQREWEGKRSVRPCPEAVILLKQVH